MTNLSNEFSPDFQEDEEEDEKVLEELEDKQLLARISAIEAENHNLKEQVICFAGEVTFVIQNGKLQTNFRTSNFEVIRSKIILCVVQ